MVDMQALKGYAVGFGVVLISIALITIITTEMGDMQLGDRTGVNVYPPGCATLWNTTNCTTIAQNYLQNGTSLIGSLITTWGSIILLGIVVVAVFVGIFVALNYMQSRQQR